MEVNALKYVLVGLAIPLFWWVSLSLILWAVRNFAPRLERLLFSPLWGYGTTAEKPGVSTRAK